MNGYYHLQNGDKIRSGDEFYFERGGIAGWFPIESRKIGKIYKAASMLPMRRKEAKPLPEKMQNKSGSASARSDT